MKDLPLNALRAFALACIHGGIRPAARELGVSHSSISRHLAELERWLGVPIVEHKGGAWTPTRQALALGHRIFAQLQEMESDTDAVRETRSPFSVTITVAPSFASRWMLSRLPSLERAHPRIELSILINQRLDALRDKIDFGIRMGSGLWPGVISEPLMDDRLYPVMSPQLWEAKGRTQDLSRLGEFRLLHDRDPVASWARWRREFGPDSLALDHGARLASSDLVLRAAELGYGVALTRGRLAAGAIAEGLLVRPFGDKEIVIPNAYWIVRQELPEANNAHRRSVDTVVRWLRDQASIDPTHTRT